MPPSTRNPSDSIFRVGPQQYLHVLDQNTNITRLVVGPTTFMRQDNELVTDGPSRMIVVPPRHHCVITNPVMRDADGAVVFLANTQQVKLRHAEREIRLTQEPFSLYPGEIISTPVTPLAVVPPNSALRLKANLDFTNEDGEAVVAGSEWLFEGPATYVGLPITACQTPANRWRPLAVNLTHHFHRQPLPTILSHNHP